VVSLKASSSGKAHVKEKTDSERDYKSKERERNSNDSDEAAATAVVRLFVWGADNGNGKFLLLRRATVAVDGPRKTTTRKMISTLPQPPRTRLRSAAISRTAFGI